MRKVKSVSNGKRAIEFEFWNDYQKEAWEVLDNSDITFITGIAGTAKTFIATAYALNAYSEKAYDKIIITRPTVPATGESMGFLPGDINAKVHPYLEPIYDCINDLCVNLDQAQKEELTKKALSVLALGFARGRTFKRSICILDEAQNATLEQLELWITRMGRGSKLIITGDPAQADIRNSCLWETIEVLTQLKGVKHFHFPETANCRHDLVSDVVKALAVIKAGYKMANRK